jgi:hypothetical protein
MTGRADPSFDVPNLLGGLRLRIVPALAAGAVAAVLTALAFAILPNPYRGTLVLVPVQASRGGAGLSGVASSILGAGIDIPRGGFSATRDVVSYLLTSRTVLLAAAATEYQGRPVSVAVAGREPQPGKDELLLLKLRARIRITSSRETDFVTVSLRARDSGAVRVLLDAMVGETRRVFASVAQAQAGQIRRAIGHRVDSARASLRRAEEALATFDDRNRSVPPRSRLALERSRLERALGDATRVWESVSADEQSAEARELETAPALAVVEGLPDLLAAPPRRILLRGALAGLMVAVLVILIASVRDLARAAARDAAV